MRHAHGREAVLLSPDDERRHGERRDAPLVREQLVEVAGAVELEVTAAAGLAGEALPVLADRVLAHPARDGAHRAGETLARVGLDQALALAGRTHHVREVVPAAVGEEAAVGDHERARRAGVVTGPAKSDRHTPVVGHERNRAELELAYETLECLDVALPGSGRVRL